MHKNHCYYKGKITTLDKVKISPYDIGFLRGYGVFDVMCTQNGKLFLLKEHWQRFQNSAKELNLKIPIGFREYKNILEKLLKLNGFKKSGIRTVLSGGESADGFSPEGKETFFIVIEKFQSLPSGIFSRGAKVITCEHSRDISRAKVTNYIQAIRNYPRKIKSKALEIIYCKDGLALEASTSNFFIVKKGKLATAKENILLGTTRNLIIRLAKENRLLIEERDIKISELFSADEVFLTATNKDIVPVVKIDGKKVGDGKVGKNTKILMEMFQEFVKKY